jgi:hypothetical protein
VQSKKKHREISNDFSQAVTVHLSHHHKSQQARILRPHSERAIVSLPYHLPTHRDNGRIRSGYKYPTWLTLIGQPEFACVIAENTTSDPLDHEHEKQRENSRKNEGNSTEIH